MQNQRILVIGKAFCLLRTFDYEKPELSLAELAKKNGLNPVTAYRILQTLVDENILIQNPDNSNYRLGYGLVKLGDIAKSNSSLLKTAHPHLEKLTKLYGETSLLDVLDKNQRIKTILIVPSTFRLGTNPNFEEPLNPHCTATGKVHLAHLPQKQLQQYIDSGLEASTTNTITDPERLVEELEKIRASGYALNLEEQEIGFIAIGAPVYDLRGQLIGAVTLGGPANRMTEQKLPEIIASVKESANAISNELGYHDKSSEKCGPNKAK